MHLKIELLELLFPENLLQHFEVKEILLLCNISTKKEIYHIKLDEKNTLPTGYDKTSYESKGFMAEKTIQDFPIRGKALYLVIRRRRWRKKEDKTEIRSDYSFIAEGSKITKELSAFLKGTGRNPRRYN